LSGTRGRTPAVCVGSGHHRFYATVVWYCNMLLLITVRLARIKNEVFTDCRYKKIIQQKTVNKKPRHIVVFKYVSRAFFFQDLYLRFVLIYVCHGGKLRQNFERP
jgi:hypothetical protein